MPPLRHPFGGPTRRRPTNMPENTISPFTTGAVARLLESTEPRVAETVRRGRVKPPPVIVAGRRLWSLDQILQAAEALDLLTDDLRQQLTEAAHLPELAPGHTPQEHTPPARDAATSKDPRSAGKPAS